MSGMRTFSRSDDGAVRRIDVRVPLDAALRLVNNEIRHRARLTRTYNDPPSILANEGRLGQVFLHLLTNALYAIPEGHSDAHAIRVTARANQDGHLVGEIADTGAG